MKTETTVFINSEIKVIKWSSEIYVKLEKSLLYHINTFDTLMWIIYFSVNSFS